MAGNFSLFCCSCVCSVGLSTRVSPRTWGQQPPELTASQSLGVDEAPCCVSSPTEKQLPLRIAPDTYMQMLASVQDELLIHITALAQVQGTDDKLTQEITTRFDYPPITIQVRPGTKGKALLPITPWWWQQHPQGISQTALSSVSPLALQPLCEGLEQPRSKDFIAPSKTGSQGLPGGRGWKRTVCTGPISHPTALPLRGKNVLRNQREEPAG